MNLKTHTFVVAFAAASALSLQAPVVSALGGQDPQASASERQTRTVQGVWRTVVTPYDCQTGVPSPSRALEGLFTFNPGGTMSEYGIRPGTTPALRSPGHGVWQREHGWHEYAFAFTFYRYNTSGVFLGSQRVSAALELAASGGEFATRSAIESFDANDILVSTSCATGVGTRFR